MYMIERRSEVPAQTLRAVHELSPNAHSKDRLHGFEQINFKSHTSDGLFMLKLHF